ncbi:hypothetical protein [Variovorax sp. Sphag1AA]|uniref:hypothetical protein n=1 Tax=Variovorax sp. Sphag1AA TaxID=2587027 RepID=UPI00160A7300|nr:hypothetical protein [Variovorax sp. Sphag1AA]MBB3179476.1 hypothetical protein [Variovorax sp. Sphag1AA]
MKLRSLVTFFILLWLASAVAVPYFAGDLSKAGDFGSSFGGVSALFSGFALALAIYSMVLQQKQSAEFERVTLGALEQQASAIKLIEESLAQQASTARTTALTALIDHEEQRVETLRQWGSMAGDENKYSNGIKAAQNRMSQYHAQLREQAGA